MLEQTFFLPLEFACKLIAEFHDCLHQFSTKVSFFVCVLS